MCSKLVFKRDSSNANFEIQNFLAWKKKQGQCLNPVGKLSNEAGPSLCWLASGTTHDLVNRCRIPLH
jgi:hypothetical protein